MSGEPPSPADRIAAARAELARRRAADPASVDRFNARMARLQAASKRERQRFDHLVCGKPRPAPVLVKPAGMSRLQWKAERQRLIAQGAKLEPGIEEAMQRKERWSHKAGGTPETLDALGTHSDALVQLERNGTIDKEQAEWAAQIANVYRSIQSDVAVTSASLEARVDQSRNPGVGLLEGMHRIRLHIAYGFWRAALPAPKQMILDMIVGDPIGYTVAARRYSVGNKKAKQRLLDALNLWPECVDRAYKGWTDEELDAKRQSAA